MSRFPVRQYGLPLLLILLLSWTAVRYWPRKASRSLHPERKGPPSSGQPNDPRRFGFDPAMRQRMDQALQKMTPEQRQAFEQRMQADRTFFDTLRDLPEDQRREKMREHFAQSPPPPGFDSGSIPLPPGGPPPGGLGDEGPGFGGPMHLPPPTARHAMDAQIANSQKNLNQ